MRKIKLITDSPADMLKEDYLKYNLEVIPLYVTLNDVSYVSTTINSQELFTYAKEKKALPKTSAVSTGDAKAVFEKYLEEDYDILFICCTKVQSNTYNAARIAAEELDQSRIRLVSSDSVSTATALLIRKAVKMIENKLSLSEIADQLEKLVPKIECQFIVDTLEYLYLGGRVSALGRILGQAFRIHPHLRTVEGKITVFKKPIGKVSKCYLSLVDEFGKNYTQFGIDLDVIYISHCMALKEDLQAMIEALSKYVDPKIIVITEVGSVVATHCGPKTIGLIYLKK